MRHAPVGLRGRLELVLADRQRADVPLADAAADLAAVVEVDDLARAGQADAAREERPAVLARRLADRDVVLLRADAAELEDVGLAQEEVALLGEEQAEAREIHLPVVDLGGREVRVDRQRGVQLRRELVDEVERRLGVAARVAGRRRASRRKLARRHDVEAVRVEPFEADRQPRDGRVVGAVARDPGDVLVLAHDAAREVEAPRVRVRIERDAT